MTPIGENLRHIRSIIHHAERAANRETGAVRLLAVSKTKPPSNIACAYQLGQRHFAESYLQEALAKQQELGAYDITWHFIGPIQSNKTRPIASRFSWVHSVDRLKIAKRLSDQRPGQLPPLNICLQVNISGENSKSGAALDDLPRLISEIKELPRLKLRGVMAIPAPQPDYELQREPYRKLNQAIARLNDPKLDTFSYGMTGDLRAAIAEGATMVRIGTALFGKRVYTETK